MLSEEEFLHFSTFLGLRVHIQVKLTRESIPLVEISDKAYILSLEVQATSNTCTNTPCIVWMNLVHCVGSTVTALI